MKNKLLKCPFCGGQAHVQQDIRGSIGGYHVVCDGAEQDWNCPMSGGMPWRKSAEEAITDWNRRCK